MSIQQLERTLEVCDGAQTQVLGRIHGPVLCVAPQELSHQELHLVAGDAQIIQSREEALAVEEGSYTSVVVYAAGLELARELLLSNALDGTGRIHWHLGQDLPDTLETLDVLAQRELPPGVRVERINHAASGTVVTTGLDSGGTLEPGSYRRGVQDGSLAHNKAEVARVGASASVRELQEKLLHTLLAMQPLIDDAPSCARAHDGLAERELALLQRKHKALQRRYNSLSTSKLGKLTIHIWALKRGSLRSLTTRSLSTSSKVR